MIEYKIMETISLMNEIQLNKFAEDGWRLVAIVPVEFHFYFYFGRMVSDDADKAYSDLRRKALEAKPNG